LRRNIINLQELKSKSPLFFESRDESEIIEARNWKGHTFLYHIREMDTKGFYCGKLWYFDPITDRLLAFHYVYSDDEDDCKHLLDFDWVCLQDYIANNPLPRFNKYQTLKNLCYKDSCKNWDEIQHKIRD